MLSLVPTPIGNLQDMTFRAVEVLKNADVILAEDTRVSGKLLKHFTIETPMRSFHAHNEHHKLESVIQELKSGVKMALITDAGTPGISDPGFLLVRECIKNDIKVECLPGATAFVPALVVSGLPCDRFVMEGFLPQKKGRKTRIEAWKNENKAIVLYESPFRLVKLLKEILEYLGENVEVSVSREISKMYEETKRGRVGEVLTYFQSKPKVKGEIVVALNLLDKI